MRNNQYSGKTPESGSRGAAARFLSACQARGKTGFSLDELMVATGLTRLAARRQIARLGSNVHRVTPRHDFFLIVSPEYQRVGAPPIDRWLGAYMRFCRQPYYVGILSAAARHGSSSQAVQVVQIVTDRPTRDIELGGLRVEFFVKKTVGSTPVIEAPNTFAPLLVSTPEATILDLIAYSHSIGGVRRAMQVTEGLLPVVRPRELKKALAAIEEASTKQRFGYILDHLNRAGLAALVKASLPARPHRALLQVRTPSERTQRIAQPWNIVENVSLGALD